MNNQTRGVVRVSVAGLGAIGRVVAQRLASDQIPGMQLSAVAARDQSKAEALLKSMSSRAPVVPLAALPDMCDVAVECAPASVVPEIVRPMLQSGKKVVVLSVGALLSSPDLFDLANSGVGQIIIPTGALLGLDAVGAAAEGMIHSVRMRTTKPIKGLLGAPYLVKNGIDISGVTKPTKIFEGNAREAAVGFPANLNVAVALSLAGIGPDRTILEIWVDPDIQRNMHQISVEADSASFDMTIKNIPSENPKTGRITALSVIAVLRRLSAPVRVGT